MVWAFVIVLVLLIPLLAIVIDSQVGQALADRIASHRSIEGGEELLRRLEALETEVGYLNASVANLQEESEFLRTLVEGREEVPRIAPGEEGAGEKPGS